MTGLVSSPQNQVKTGKKILCRFRRGPTETECLNMGINYYDEKFCCSDEAVTKGKLCRNHLVGHNTLKQNMYFSRTLQRHVTESEHTPEYKDLKFSFVKKAFFIYDGKKWRKSCEVCWAQAKAKNGRHCKNHDPEYPSTGNKSKIACKFLDALEKELNQEIMHYHVANNGIVTGKEYRIPDTDYSADGYIAETKTIYEFLGDYWHGNPETQKLDTKNKKKKTHADSYNDTFRRFKNISDKGYTIYYIWEKTYNDIKDKHDVKLMEYMTLFDPNKVPYIHITPQTKINTDINIIESIDSDSESSMESNLDTINSCKKRTYDEMSSGIEITEND
jgi:hypothetical protein